MTFRSLFSRSLLRNFIYLSPVLMWIVGYQIGLTLKG